MSNYQLLGLVSPVASLRSILAQQKRLCAKATKPFIISNGQKEDYHPTILTQSIPLPLKYKLRYSMNTWGRPSIIYSATLTRAIATTPTVPPIIIPNKNPNITSPLSRQDKFITITLYKNSVIIMNYSILRGLHISITNHLISL